MKILIVDDFEIGRISVKNLLNELGFNNTIEVSNGYSAIANLKSKIIDCVITECDMSEMSGLELLKQIRKDKFLKNIPVFIVIENGLTDIIVSASKAGASGFLFKPFNKDNLFKNLNEVLIQSKSKKN
tara:strand:+ start:132 stop:515 length:384 start_codon:yes stop_codon:yes gene_type:complete